MSDPTVIVVPAPEPEEPAAVIVPETPPAPVMSEADVADLARLRAEESAREEDRLRQVEFDAEIARNEAEAAARMAAEALESSHAAEVEALEAEAQVAEKITEENREAEDAPPTPEEDETPNIEHGWFRPIGHKD